MCVTHSLEDEERSTEIDNNTTDHQSDAMVSNVLFFYLISAGLERRKWLKYLVGHTQDVTVDDDDPNFNPTAPVLEDESPYPEVRAAVANTDDPNMPSSTFRAWAVGLMWAVLIPGLNQVFYFRYPSVQINEVCENPFPMAVSVSLFRSQLLN